MDTVDRSTYSEEHCSIDHACSTRIRVVGTLFIVLGAAFCGLAVLSLSASPASLPAPAPIVDATAKPAATPLPTPIPETQRRIEEALAKPFPPAAGIPAKARFDEAIARFSKLLPVPIDLDSESLTDANIHTKAEVEFPHGQRTVGQVLDYLLARQSRNLTWAVVHGALCITTVDKAWEYTDARAYDVSDLVEPVVTDEGAEGWDSKELLEALGVSFESLADGEDRMSCVNANGRTILIARFSRRGHQDLVTALAKIREVANQGSPAISSSRRRREVRSATVRASSRTVAPVTVAALQALMSPASDSTVAMTDATSNAFAFDLYRQLRSRHSGNACVCPFGLYVVLALLKEAASGETERQIARVLHADQNGDALSRFLPELTNRLEAINLVPDYELSIASRGWCEESNPAPKDFSAALRDRYHVEIDSAPFSSRPGYAESLINDWAKHATDGRITEMIDASDIVAGQIDFAITNAVVFRGLWAAPFERKRSLRAPFHAMGKIFDVVVMRSAEKEFPFGEVDGVQILELPYRSGLMSALVLLPPDKPGALEQLEGSLSVNELKKYRRGMRESPVKVELPRFEIASDFRFQEPLKALGMPRAFERSADFAKLGRRESNLAYLRQKTLLTVNEEGTEATSATTAGMGGGAAEVHLFRADRPFLFLVQEKSTGLILFVARVTDPEHAPY